MSDKRKLVERTYVEGSSSTPEKGASSECPTTPKKAKLEYDFWKVASSPTACNKQIIKVADLKERYYPNRSLKLRICYFTSFTSRSDKTIFKFHGEDETGMIQCVSFDDSRSKLGNLILKLNEFVTINDFRVVKENPSYSSGLNDGLEIVLLAGTQIAKADVENNLTPMVFDFVPLNSLEKFDVSSKIDVIAIVVQDFEASGNKKGPTHSLAITDKSKTTVQLAVWKPIQGSPDMNDFPVVIIRKATVQEYNGRRTLSCWNDACIWVRPDTEDAQNLDEWFNDERLKLGQMADNADASVTD